MVSIVHPIRSISGLRRDAPLLLSVHVYHPHPTMLCRQEHHTQSLALRHILGRSNPSRASILPPFPPGTLSAIRSVSPPTFAHLRIKVMCSLYEKSNHVFPRSIYTPSHPARPPTYLLCRYRLPSLFSLHLSGIYSFFQVTIHPSALTKEKEVRHAYPHAPPAAGQHDPRGQYPRLACTVKIHSSGGVFSTKRSFDR